MATMDRQHTADRIDQFWNESNGDRNVFESKILRRAMKSSAEKREITAQLLEDKGEHELAGKVRGA